MSARQFRAAWLSATQPCETAPAGSIERRAWEDAEIRRMWGEGAVTAAIAIATSLSKNAVIGRAHRMHLPSRGSPIVRHARPPAAVMRPAPSVEEPAPRPRPTAITAHQASPAIEPSARRMPLPPPKPQGDCYPSAMRCQFPSWPHEAGPGHPAFGTFCGAKRDPGSAYCLSHRRVCYSTRVALASMPLDGKDAAA